MQLGVCTFYALLMWIIRINPIKLLGLQSPEAMKLPKIPLMLIQYSVIFGGCVAAAMYFKPIVANWNRR